MRRSFVAVAVATAIVASVASCSTGSTTRTQAQDLVTFGGPAGWSTQAVAGRLPDDSHVGTVDGVPVTFVAGDQPGGARVRWASPVDAADSTTPCAQLAEWLTRASAAWPSAADTSTARAACEQAVQQRRTAIVAAGAGAAENAHGRVTYAASVQGGKTLVATLEFNADA